ncbi:MAG: hypothetical protein ABSC26_09160, partial [Stellaceae bacterium]
MVRRGGILLLLLTGLAACGPRTEPPAPVTIHGDYDALRTPPPESPPPVLRDSTAPPPGVVQGNSTSAPPEARARGPEPTVVASSERARESGGQIMVQNGDTLYAVS